MTVQTNQETYPIDSHRQGTLDVIRKLRKLGLGSLPHTPNTLLSTPGGAPASATPQSSGSGLASGGSSYSKRSMRQRQRRGSSDYAPASFQLLALVEDRIKERLEDLHLHSVIKVLEMRKSKKSVFVSFKIRAPGRIHPARLELEKAGRGSTLSMTYGAKHETYCHYLSLIKTNCEFWQKGDNHKVRQKFFPFRFFKNIPNLWFEILEYCRGPKFWTKDRPCYFSNTNFELMKRRPARTGKKKQGRKHHGSNVVQRNAMKEIKGKGFSKLVKFFTPKGEQDAFLKKEIRLSNIAYKKLAQKRKRIEPIVEEFARAFFEIEGLEVKE